MVLRHRGARAMTETPMNPGLSDAQGADLQQDSQRVSPFPQLPTSAPDAKRNPTNGQVGIGNTLALKPTSGRYSRQLQEDAAPWRAEQIAAIRADLGDDVATVKAHAVDQLGTVLVILSFLGGNLM